MKTMKLRTVGADPAQHKSELLLVPVFESGLAHGHAGVLATASMGVVAAQAEVEGFSGKHGQTMLHFSGKQLAASRTLYFGLGEQSKLTPKRLRDALKRAFGESKRLKLAKLGLALPALSDTGISLAEFGAAVAETAATVDYVINHKKTKKGGYKPEVRFAKVTLVGEAASDPALAKGLETGYAVARAVNMARDLVTEPAGTMTPSHLAEHAVEVGKASGGKIKVKLYHKRELEKMGAGAFLAVARGSEEKPVLIEMSYEPENADPNVLLALIGKSVTFDSGGYDLKPAAGMRTMKCDMAGGAATLSAMGAIAALELPVRVKVVMAATENLINGKAYKPGDVLTSMAGLTIEVDNTDAEGRLTMADAIEFVRRKGATHIVDIATLTGAIRVALGSVGAGAFGNTPDFTRKVIDSGAAVGELAWELPLWEDLARANESKIADLKNSGGDAGAGSITAALFLSRFAAETPWVHLDIAAVAFEGDQGTGFGVRTLVELARKFACEKSN